ncbi:MAG: universal stress protein [Actinobacteria bacterium]|nr:universal stress protein [Actinomycetota bacterium]
MRVLIALDGSKSSEKALDFAISSGVLDKSEIILFHAVPTLNLISKSAYEKLLEQEALSEAERYLIEKKNYLEALGYSVKIKLSVGDPKENILHAAEEEEVEMIILGTKGLSGIARALIGSVAQYVITFSRIPVLVVPSKD